MGLGDTIQFCRFAKVLAADGASVVLGVPPSLAPLLSGMEGVAGRNDECRLAAAGLSLPAVEPAVGDRHRPHNIPAEQQYLRANPVLVASYMGNILGERRRPRIGLVWSGNPLHGNDRSRSIPLDRFIRIANGPFEFVCLQQDIRAADQPALEQRPDIRRFAERLADLQDTAALMHHMDLVISVDSALAHLAGALGIRVWILLPNNPDWRWQQDREDSPWYPTARLFRQPRPGDWQSGHRSCCRGVGERGRGMTRQAPTCNCDCERTTGRGD